MFHPSVLIYLISCACATFTAESVVVFGCLWTDTSENAIQALEAGILKVRFLATVTDEVTGRVDVLLVREDKSDNGTLFKAVSCCEVCL